MSGKFARLDKETGLRVLCWRPRWPGELARVGEKPRVAAVGFPSVGLSPMRDRSRAASMWVELLPRGSLITAGARCQSQPVAPL